MDIQEKVTPRDLVAMYVQLRDQLAEEKAAFVAKERAIKERMARIEGQLMEKMGELEVDSLKTPAGTAYLNERVSVLTSDKTAFLDYVRENEAWDLLQVQGAKSGIQEYVLENNDVPPGISITRMQTVGIRRA